jgi:hypothetical protein
MKLREYPAFKTAMKKAEKDLANRGMDSKDPQYALRGLHHTKLALDDMIGEAMRAGKNNEAATLIEMKRKLLEDLEKASPAYKTARLAYAGDSEMLTAMEEGTKRVQDVRTRTAQIREPVQGQPVRDGLFPSRNRPRDAGEDPCGRSGG